MIVKSKYGTLKIHIPYVGNVRYKEYGYPVDELKKLLKDIDDCQELSFYVCTEEKGKVITSDQPFVVNRVKYRHLTGKISNRGDKPYVHVEARRALKLGEAYNNNGLSSAAYDKIVAELTPELLHLLENLPKMKERYKTNVRKQSIEAFKAAQAKIEEAINELRKVHI